MHLIKNLNTRLTWRMWKSIYYILNCSTAKVQFIRKNISNKLIWSIDELKANSRQIKLINEKRQLVLSLFDSIANGFATSHCVQMANQWTHEYYIDAEEHLSQEALNCARYIPSGWRQLMLRHEKTMNQLRDNRECVPQQYLFTCLQVELRQMNETSPFSFTSPNATRIEYMALNEVVSLGFDGSLVTKARAFAEYRY